MKTIQLTRDDGYCYTVNPLRVAYVGPLLQAGGTRINFSGLPDDFIDVTESYQSVYELLRDWPW